MRVHHPLGAAGGTRGVAGRGGRVLVDFDETGLGILDTGQYVLIGNVRRSDAIRAGDDHPVQLHAFTDLLEQRKQTLVHYHQRIARIVHCVRQLFGAQPRIQRVKDRADRRDREVGFEVLMIVPVERGDPIARLDSEFSQRGGQPTCAIEHLSVGVPMEPARTALADDIGVGPQRPCATDNGRNIELVIHHRIESVLLSPAARKTALGRAS